MRFFALLTCGLLLVGCQEKSQAYQPANSGRLTAAICEKSDDPFSCLRAQCRAAKADFNENDLTCRCKGFALFAISSLGACLPALPSQDKSVLEFEVHRQRAMRLSIEFPEKPDQQAFSHVKNLAVPIMQDGVAAISIFRNSQDFRDSIRQLSRALKGELLNFHLPETYLYDPSINDAIWNKTYSILRHVYVLPSAVFPVTGDSALDEELRLIEQTVGQPLAGGVAQRFSDSGCAELCTVRYDLPSNPRFTAYRQRLYSGGNIFDDHITIIDTLTSEVAMTLYLLDNKLSHFLLRNDNGEIWLYGNDGPSLDAKRIALAIPAPAKPLGSSQNSTSNSSHVPVAIFEGTSDADIDRSAWRGPFGGSHVFGWFRTEDKKPFFFGRNLSRYSEESGSDASHGHQVASLASQGFRRPLLPFFPDHLWSGDFTDFLKNFPTRFIGSISTANLMPASYCASSEFGKILRATTNQALWVAAAGNSGRAMEKTVSLNCPQNLSASNLVVVAAIADNENSLDRISTSGETYADLAANGCKPEEKTCNQGYTSFAAPRVARLAADLQEEFPSISPAALKSALIMTSKVPVHQPRIYGSPYNVFLSVRSGGVVDAVAARAFLRQSPDMNLLDRLINAKAHQYPRFHRDDVKTLITDQLNRLKNLKENLQ